MAQITDLIPDFDFNKTFNHGFAMCKKEMLNQNGEVIVPIKTQGMITAFLPEEDKYAIYFDNTQWITFDKNSLDEYCFYHHEETKEEYIKGK